ncbi:RNHCP domain-containing protein [Alicyclobacillus dauci]|uniref:RNHCP domain-containing protein n=1 Tax=Alicyclobacillus dauci TaxID=1475485 RepID=A0ABY6Z8D4_9BACL|nr:RNHCP domain-containing protein [Alicyclobacillus dauci]WAH39054.1 RNHCP domain-containing protein [Alicyclobacillus dauci]
MALRTFTRRNESFTCVNCGNEVEPSQRSCRNHCPNCLHSVHLDIMPGDRAANCSGLMVPIRVEYHTKKGYQLVHRCQSCGHISRNVVQTDVQVQPDNQEAILDLMAHPRD